MGDEMATVVNLIWVYSKAIYFLPEGWTRFCENCPTDKSLGRKAREEAAAQCFPIHLHAARGSDKTMRALHLTSA
jgi:hypothetical protein